MRKKKERMNFIDGRSYKSTMVIVDWIYDSNGKVIELFFFSIHNKNFGF